jgi:hypothetical protein
MVEGSGEKAIFEGSAQHERTGHIPGIVERHCRAIARKLENIDRSGNAAMLFSPARITACDRLPARRRRRPRRRATS